jgi:hypothetical protein
MSSVKDVLECRIGICGWLVDHGFGDTSLEEEHSALSRELENLDTRSDLDSTRVHVDEEALREWFSEKQYASTARYIQTVLAEDAAASHGTLLAYYNEEKRREMDAGEEDDNPYLRQGHIGPEFILLDIVERTLKTFVTDRSFGLDSYLSRRIRHGTLSGFLLTPIAKSITRLEDAATDPDMPPKADQSAEVADQVMQWRNELSITLDHARRHLLQVRGEEHPEGLIDPTWRTSVNVTHLDAMISRVRERVLATGGNYDIFSDVYALCWDLTERELGRLRSFLIVDFLKPQMEKLGRIYADLSFEEREFARPFFQDLDRTLNGRVQEVCGWFVRPVFRRDTYNLRNLVDSTISIIRELQESYDLTEDVRVSESLTVNRSLFELVGDILYILLGNAAKHAQRGSTIIVEAETAGKTDLLLSVRSIVASREDFDHHLNRIKRACNVSSESDLQAAAVGEGFSGIRKIIGLLQRLRTSDAGLKVKSDKEKLSLNFSIALSERPAA